MSCKSYIVFTGFINISLPIKSYKYARLSDMDTIHSDIDFLGFEKGFIWVLQKKRLGFQSDILPDSGGFNFNQTTQFDSVFYI